MMIILYYQVAVKFALYILLYENWHIVEREPCIIDLVRGERHEPLAPALYV